MGELRLVAQLAFAVLVALLSWRLYSGVYIRFELGKELPPFNSGPGTDTEWGECTGVQGALGVEDLLALDDWTILGTNLDLLGLWKLPGDNPALSDPAKNAIPGHIFVLKLSREDGRPVSLTPVEIVGRPSGVAFHCHGFGRTGDLLVVINHAYSQGGERLEKFRIVRNEEGNVQLHYLSFVDASFANGVLNDIVPISETDLFVTRWLPWTDPIEGRRLSLLFELYNVIGYLSSNEKLSQIYHCHKDVCKEIGPRGKLWNGITVDHEHQVLYALDLLLRTVHVWQYGSVEILEDGAAQLNLTEQGTFLLPEHYGDNLEFDPKTRTIWTAGMAKIGASYLGYVDAVTKQGPRRPAGGPVGDVASSSVITRVSVDDPSKLEYILHDGSILGALSGSVFVRPVPGVEVVVAGSFIDNGVLVCRRAD